MIKNGHPVTTYRESGLKPPEGKDWDTEYDGDRFDSLTREEQDLIEAWVRSNFQPAGHYSDQEYNSYWFKHRFEQLIGHYVSNDQAKDAFLSWGFKPKDEHAYNWVFEIKPYVDRDIFRLGVSNIRTKIVSLEKDHKPSDFWKYEDLSKYNCESKTWKKN